MAKNTVCLWYDKDAEAAAQFYAETFPDSAVTAVHRAPGDYPNGKKGNVLTVEFTSSTSAALVLTAAQCLDPMKHSHSKSPPKISQRPTGIGTRLSPMEAKRALVAGEGRRHRSCLMAAPR